MAANYGVREEFIGKRIDLEGKCVTLSTDMAQKTIKKLILIDEKSQRFFYSYEAPEPVKSVTEASPIK